MRTSSIEEVRDTLGRIYAKPVLTPIHSAKTLDAVMNYCTMKDLRLYYRRYGASVRLEFPETGYLLQIIPLRGSGELTAGKTTIALAPGSTAIISTDMSWELDCSADYEHITVRIDAGALTQRLETLTGVSIDEPVRMALPQGSENPAATLLPRYINSLVNTVSGAGQNEPLPGWWVTQTEQLLMTMVLCCNRHNFSHLLEGEASMGAVAEVRRAESYMEANWRNPISLQDIAVAAGVSELSLFRSFRQYRDYSPLEFLARIRAGRGGSGS